MSLPCIVFIIYILSTTSLGVGSVAATILFVFFDFQCACAKAEGALHVPSRSSKRMVCIHRRENTTHILRSYPHGECTVASTAIESSSSTAYATNSSRPSSAPTDDTASSTADGFQLYWLCYTVFTSTKFYSPLSAPPRK